MANTAWLRFRKGSNRHLIINKERGNGHDVLKQLNWTYALNNNELRDFRNRCARTNRCIALTLALLASSCLSVAKATCPIQAPALPNEPAIEVASGKELAAALKASKSSNGPKHIVLLPGKYRVPRRSIIISVDNVTIRGKTGNRDDV